MTSIGGLGNAPILTSAPKQSVAGEPLAAEAQRLPKMTVKEFKCLHPVLSEVPKSVLQRILDLAEVFGIDTADHPTLLQLYNFYVQSPHRASAFEEMLNHRDTHGSMLLHCAVMK